MILPLHDDNPTRGRPIVTVALIVACSVVFFGQVIAGPGAGERIVYAFGVIPAVLFGDAHLPPDLAVVPPAASIFTSMFLHGGLWHLLGNMLYLWIFGNNVEDSMGHGRFVAFYLLSGFAAALAQILADMDSAVPMVGASGAIGGVMGGYIVLYPRVRVHMLVPIGFLLTTIAVPAFLMLGYWLVVQLISGFLTLGAEGGGVAFWAHIGGFVAGVVLVLLFKDPRLVARHPYYGWNRPSPTRGWRRLR